MKITTFTVLLTVMLLTSGVILGSTIQESYALKAKGVGIQKYGSSTGICGDQLCSEIPGGYEAWKQQQSGVIPIIPDYGLEAKNISPGKDYNIKPGTQMTGSCTCSEDGTCTCGAGCNCAGPTMQQGMHGQCQCGPDGCNCTGCSCSENGICTCHGVEHQCSCGGHGMDGTCASCGGHSGMKHGMTGHGMDAISGTIQSETDPGKGHEQHQLAVMLAPRDRPYSGLLTYTASENVQLVALHGPLPEGKVKGQPTWTPDGKTHFALTLVDQQNKMGTWMFTGNALAAHSFSTEPFAITYSIVTMDHGNGMSVHEKRTHGASCMCASDCTCDKDGVCTCSGETGPCMCGPNCNCGQ